MVRFAVKSALVLLLVLSPVAGYLLTAYTLGSIPVNHGFAQSSAGVSIYVWSNGVHTDLVVPTSNELMNWRRWFPLQDFRQPPAANFVAFGWGDKGFFLNVPEWRDLTVKVALDALLFDGEAARHVTMLDQPPPLSSTCLRVLVSTNQYRLLTAYLTNSFKLNPASLPVRINAPGYGEADAFYEATGSYGPIHTCNEWTGAGLRKTGVKTGLWTPFETSVMKHLAE
jgi:uncharacterized protein (TIGR02117 family)